MAKNYLERFKSFSGNPYLELARDIWLIDILAKRDGVKNVEKKIADVDQKYRGTEGYNFFYKYFCKNSPGEFLECFKQIYGKEVPELEVTEDRSDDNSVSETYKTSNLVEPKEDTIISKGIELYVEEGSFDTDFVKGLILSVETQNLPLVIKSGIPKEGFYLNVAKRTLTLFQQGGGKNISLTPNYKQALDIVGTDSVINKSQKVYIIVGEAFKEEGEYLKKIFDELGTSSALFGFDTKEIRFEYRYDEMYYGGDNISFVAIGREREILEYVPFIKFTSANPDNVVIFTVTDIFSGKEMTADYDEYFKGTRLISFFNSLIDVEDRAFSLKFQDYYGKNPEFEAYLGRDVAKSVVLSEGVGINFKIKPIQIGKNRSIKVLGGWYD